MSSGAFGIFLVLGRFGFFTTLSGSTNRRVQNLPEGVLREARDADGRLVAVDADPPTPAPVLFL